MLPDLVLEKMPLSMQVLFFGALLSAIKSTASATLLAPSVTFVENIWRPFLPHQGDRIEFRTDAHHGADLQRLRAVPTPSALQGKPIYEMVSGAYKVTLVGAIVPLSAGLYWKRATTQGAVFSIVLGMLAPGCCSCRRRPASASRRNWSAYLMARCVGMVLGSLAPQAVKHQQGSHHGIVGQLKG